MSMSGYITYLQAATETTLRRRGRRVYDDESGAVSTETAIITLVLVSIAVAAGVILFAKMTSNANAIPDVVTPPGS